MASERLAVLLGGRLAGWLERSDSEVDPSFRYSDDYIADGDIALSARLPIQRQPFPANRVLPYLLGLIPENTEARQRWATQLNVAPDDVFGMLAAMGWDCPGAVQFCAPEGIDELLSRSLDYAQTDAAAIGARHGQCGSTRVAFTP